jgi:hypothetical protein
MAHFSDMRQRGPSKEPQNFRILDGRSTLSGSAVSLVYGLRELSNRNLYSDDQDLPIHQSSRQPGKAAKDPCSQAPERLLRRPK